VKLRISYGDYAVQCHSVTDYGISRKLICDFLLVINSNLPCTVSETGPRLDPGFRDLGKVQNRYISLPNYGLTPPPDGGIPLGRSP